ncbi:hypothetical protein [Chromobacterium haemolyticum]|uniref:hypothetical protein n=1 Tax=Chromobacterium haemolyticum TaxID=394935 RepID=UPI00137519BC|nr:hypothetical protein [Chromobacterium haemolyticum]
MDGEFRQLFFVTGDERRVSGSKRKSAQKKGFDNQTFPERQSEDLDQTAGRIKEKGK